MTGIATVAAIKHQRHQSPAERRHPDAAGGDGCRSGPMACKAYLRSESASGSLSSNGRSNLVAWAINPIESHGGTPSVGWWSRVSAWSLGWVSARNQERLLVGFVNVAWEGITGSWWTPRPAAATNTSGLVVSSCGRPAERQSRRLASILNRTLLGCTSTPAGFIGPTLVSSICRQVGATG
jgi:hypothetical protein